MKKKAYRLIKDLIFLGFLLYILIYNHGKQEQRDVTIESFNHKLDSIANHIHFMNSEHYGNCAFVANDNYKPFYPEID